MHSVTLRNIPNEIMNIIRELSKKEKRSINSEVLLLLENSVIARIFQKEVNVTPRISVDAQVALWKNLAGKWKDKRRTKEIINDIYESRTLGREIGL